MKCSSCGKNFDYEKYYGICPKCGGFHKTETSQEQHQRYHDRYDGGYQHLDQTYVTKRNTNRSTRFLLVSIVVFLVCSFAGPAFGVLYSKSQIKKLQKEVIESEVEHQEHDIGEAFSFQGMTLTVTEAWVLDKGWEDNPELAKGKKLAAIKLKGESDGEWVDANRVSDAYVSYDGACFSQIYSHEFADYAEQYGIKLFGNCDLCNEKEAEGCLLFWVDDDKKEFTLCLEEREGKNMVFIDTIHSLYSSAPDFRLISGKNLVFINTIHSIKIRLEEESADE